MRSSPQTENDRLLPETDNDWPHTLEEYESIGVIVVENEEKHPVVMHDLSGPVLLELDQPALERRDSYIEQISLMMDDKSTITDLPPSDVGGQVSLPSLIASMTKNIIGCGALSLCNGIARCANSPSAFMAGNFWILIMGVVFAYFCWLIGKVCKITGRTTYRGIWQETVGYKGSVFVSIANALKAAMADLAYATILSDTLRSIFASMGLDVSRIICLLLVTLLGILPLCMLKSLAVLAPFSILGTVGILFTALAMGVRYFDGSYLPGGQFYNEIDAVYQPYFGTTNDAWSASILPFVCMIYEAYVMHYNSARFYTELKDRNLPRFGIAVSISFGISAVLYMAISSFGYLTFGGNSAGFILNNYSPHDPLVTISRVAVGLSTLMAYPIVFFGVRDGVLDMFEVPLADQTPQKINSLTVLLLGILTVFAIFVTDLGLINAVGGGLVSPAIVCLFPTLMFRAAIKRMSGSTKRKNLREFGLSSWLTGIGVLIGVVGAGTALVQQL